MTSAVVIIPWRDKGDTWRQANLCAVLSHLNGFSVEVVSDGLEGSTPFNRSRAYNLGTQRRPDADVFVFHEADMLLSAPSLLAAISLAATSPGMVVPFDTYWYLTPSDTERVRDGDMTNLSPERVMANGTSNGACNVVSAESMAAVGCWDEEFSGWGFDDRAMARAFEVACHTPTRYVTAVGVHLWHKPGWSATGRFHGGSHHISPTELAATQENERRYRRYKKARTPSEVRALTAGCSI